jgi:hypothetical protein
MGGITNEEEEEELFLSLGLRWRTYCDLGHFIRLVAEPVPEPDI